MLVSDGLENRLQRCYPTSSHVTVRKNVVLTLFISLSILIQQEINHFNTSALQAQVLPDVDLISTFEFHYLAIECSLNSVQLFTLMKKLFLWFYLNKFSGVAGEDDFADSVCNSVNKCPELCKCSQGGSQLQLHCLMIYDWSGVVDCRNLGLTQVPSDLPPNTVELWAFEK